MKQEEANTENRESRLSRIMDFIFAGRIIDRNNFTKRWKMILFIFVLFFLYITYNSIYDKAAIRNIQNEKTIKNLKADYDTKSAKLLFMSKRDKIEEMLIYKGSELRKPENPAYRIEAE